ncbi:MAG: hypothetical protein ABS882_02110 [Lysinibacillus sp.]
MTKQIIAQALTNDENAVIFIVHENQNYQIVLYQLHSKLSHVLFTTTYPVKQFVNFSDSIYFICNEEILQLLLTTQETNVITKATMLNSYNSQAFIYEQKGQVFSYNVATKCHTQLVTDIEKMYRTAGEMVLYKKNEEIVYMCDGKEQRFPVQCDIESVALSFDGQYMAFFNENEQGRHFYIYDLQEHIVQNMTELLGETIGYNGPELAQLHACEMPAWTEMNAFYFLVTANDETRLYYGDLYGTLLPASPEDEYIYSYTISNSGNWAVTSVLTKQHKMKCYKLDITTGNEMEIII